MGGGYVITGKGGALLLISAWRVCPICKTRGAFFDKYDHVCKTCRNRSIEGFAS